MTGAEKTTETYRKWWKGKKIQIPGYAPEIVKDVVFIGSPSAVYGIAEFTFKGGNKRPFGSINSFKPRKKDIKIVS